MGKKTKFGQVNKFEHYPFRFDPRLNLDLLSRNPWRQIEQVHVYDLKRTLIFLLCPLILIICLNIHLQL